ncbi:MAG: VWA domain-containing protein [Candidatus Abyssubacteria bacterium]
MHETITHFIDVLRDAGVRVALSENIDCFRALEITGLEDKRAFKYALRSTLIKRSSDIPVFEKLFEMFFSSLTRPPESENEEPALGVLPFGTTTIEEFVDSYLGENRERFENLANLFEWELGGDFLLTVMHAGTHVGLSEISNPLQVGFFSKKLRDSLGWNKLAEEIERLREDLIGQGYSDAEIGRLLDYIEHRMKTVFDAVREHVRRQLERNTLDAARKFREEDLLQKNFFQLSQHEIEAMREIVARLGRKLKDKLILRSKRTRRGRVDVKGVVRRSLQYGGIPMELSFKNRRRERPEIFALCDISDSVAYASRFMLQFLYTLQEIFSKVRTFVFVTEIADVTALFSEHEIHEALDLALHSRNVDYNGHSNFGYAFHKFSTEYLDLVTPRTTLIIMGDARNNRNDPRVWAFRKIAERAKRVIWLNPESRAGWRFGDSVMYHYLPYCDEAHECRNALQLTRIVDKLVLD